MYIDWITWSVWSFGLALLLYWGFETARETATRLLTLWVSWTRKTHAAAGG